jgi:hypothetical protein
MSIEIGHYSRAKGNLVMTVPKGRRVNGRPVPYKVKILGDPDDPIPMSEGQVEIRKDLGNNKITLVPTSSRGGRIVVV